MVKVETGKNTNLTKVLDLITTLKREELLALNEAIINLLKSQQAQQAATSAHAILVHESITHTR